MCSRRSLRSWLVGVLLAGVLVCCLLLAGVLVAAKAGRQEASAHIKDRGMYSPPAAGRLACALANRGTKSPLQEV